MAGEMRNGRGPGLNIDRGQSIGFTFDGHRIEGYAGDTIGSALAGAGMRTMSRSFKYHRPRGLLCVAGRCPNCLMTVDGTPNVRACTTPALDGMVVRSQNVWPSVGLDAMSVLDSAEKVLPVGFYYKAMHKPKALWEAARPIIRRAGGLGSINPESDHHPAFGHRSVHVDVMVVGGGDSGTAAAAAAAGGGSTVVLVDDQPKIGAGRRPAESDALASLLADPSIEVWSGSTAFGFYSDNLVTVLSEGEVLTVRAGRVVLATGAHEVPFLFPGNDLPGLMLASGALRLMRMYGVLPGRRAVVATLDESGYEAAAELAEAGVEVAAILDARSSGSAAPLSVAPAIRVETGASLIGAAGRGRVKGAVFADSGGRNNGIPCDLLVMAGRLQPTAQLALQAGCATRYDAGLGAIVPTDPPDGVYLAGRLTGTQDPQDAAEEGRQRGAAAALGLPQPPGAAGQDPCQAPNEVQSNGRSGKIFVCPCEDVTVGDLRRATAEGFGDIQILKRYSTATMGPCQGGMCLRNFSETAAATTDSSIAGLGLITMRPPSAPVPLGALAGPGHLPVKTTALHHRHLSLGARMADAGGWQRPHSYGDPHGEAIAVRERVGIIDVSTLGKLDVRGTDAPRLLDFLYANVMSNLRVGRVRYGVMCLEDGTALDDGTVTRLDDGRYLVTTTTGNVEMIEQWCKWWMEAEGALDVQMADVTSGLAAINVAGPLARQTLWRLTDANLSPEAFRYMRAAQASVAGVPAILLRIGFVGETGWEVHFPAEYAEHVWDSICDAGSEHGIRAFGLEAQRILRLEKGHIIVNQDTDSVSTPIELGMEWAVRMTKQDFVGRAGLRNVRRREPRHRLVGFEMDPASPVPPDGAAIVDDGTPVGRVTSGRRSPTTGLPFGLAMVTARLAQEGRPVHILVGSDMWAATVRMAPFYDPDGKRLRA